MATALINLFVHVREQILVLSHLDGTPVRLAGLRKYQSLPLRVTLLDDDPESATHVFQRLSVSNLALRISVNDSLDTATPKAQQTSWTANSAQNYFEGTLALNTAALNALIANSDTTQVYFLIEFSEAGGDWTPVYQQLLTIGRPVTQPTTTAPDVLNSYRTAQESDGLYLQAIMKPGIQLGIRSPSGAKIRWLGVDDDGTRIDDVADFP